ncbi:glycolipid transfer protein 2-like isoform X2 [Apium graveolens]
MKRRREMEMELKMRSELRSAIEEFSKEALKVQPVDDQVQNAAAHIPLKPFLFLCNMVLQVLDKIGPTMAVLRQDIHQNIQRLEKFQESNPLLYSNVVEILKKDKNEVCARHVASCSRAFVWLTRSLNFTVTLLRLLLKDSELKMERAVEEAYIITLKPWHGWITSTAYKDFLTSSDIGFALTEPTSISGVQVLEFWRSGVYDNGGAHGSPSLIFSSGENEYVVTLSTVRQALQLPEDCVYSTVDDSVLQNMMVSLGYEGTLTKLGQLKRSFIRREWSFFFDCITKAFANKCTNFDAIPIFSQQIG